ncbi:MAG: ABC transporter ATP-binding protein [Gammaproteobacteria bacterium]|nr:ABC transporter ATP-binding protein [Gammaproteobacteria bacterium]
MVEVERLRFGYGSEALFRNMDLSLRPGGIHGLVGLNGAGKSTLLRLVAGLLFPAAGRLRVLGHEPSRREPGFLSRLFVLPEELNVPGITDREYLAARSPFYPGFDHVRMERHLEELEVPRGRTLTRLSHGQRKKFLLAFGLSTNASLVMLDEPTNGLDIPSKGLFRRLVAEALEEDRLFVIATHQVRDVEALVDRLLVLHDGKVLFHGGLFELSGRIRISLDTRRPGDDEKGLLYSEPTAGGFASVWRDANAGDGHLDLEMLFKAVIARPDEFAALSDEGDRV